MSGRQAAGKILDALQGQYCQYSCSVFGMRITYPLFLSRRSLDAVSALDNVGLQAYRARTAVKLQEETAGIAEDTARLISSPERGGTCTAVLADGL